MELIKQINDSEPKGDLSRLVNESIQVIAEAIQTYG